MPRRVFTGAEYATLPDAIREEGPWHLLDNPNHNYYETRKRSSSGTEWLILMGVNHITAGIDDWTPPDDSAEATSNYGATTDRQASWHGIVDSDSIIPQLPDTHTAWSQGVSGYEFNRNALSLEIGARSADWDTKPIWWVEQTLRNAAIWWAPRVIEYSLPLRYVTDRDEVWAMLQRGEKVGFTDHYILAGTNYRNDPGWNGSRNTFPRQMFLDYVQEEVEKLQELRNPTVPVVPEPPTGRNSSGTVFFLGAEGDDVADWQDGMALLGYLAPDTYAEGLFGDSTDFATREFQSDMQLTVDGRVGQASLEAEATALTRAVEGNISGSNRYSTAIEVSKKAFPNGTATVYLISGEGVVDGISASSLYGAKLLVRPNSTKLPVGVAEEIARLRPVEIRNVGGDVTVAQVHKARVAAGLLS